MIQAKRAELTTYLCGFAFLMGGMSGCLTTFLCSDQAQNHLTSYIIHLNNNDVIIACFAAELLSAVFALILSLVAYGFVLVPVLDSIFGYCFGFACILIIQSTVAFTIQGLLFFSFIPDTLVLIRLTVISSEISYRNTQSWISSGNRAFDLKYSLHSVWAYLYIILIAFALRHILFI